jgi:iron(II)-dependent oxidoreductase
VRSRVLALVDTLSDQELQVPYHPGVNPPLWEMGHAAFFYEVFVRGQLDGKPSFDPAMDDLWDSFHVDHRERWSDQLFPGREATRHYFNTIYHRVQARIESQPLTDAAQYLYRYSIFHQTMHIESMTWCRQNVGYPVPPGLCTATPLAQRLNGEGDATVPAGRYRLGMPGDSAAYAGEDFAFDNEKPAHDVDLDAFRMARTLVTNAEFQDFVDDGGYARPEFWSFGGRQWLARNFDKDGDPEQRSPVYWSCRNGEWHERFFDQWRPLQDDYPVTHVTFWEAEAYCHWAGRRLPTEQEWEAAALGNVAGEPRRRFPWGDEFNQNALDMSGRYMAQLPVTALPEGDSPFGCRQMLGTVWEWTTSQFLPYDGFKVDVYPYMSTLQFGDHKVSKGGCCAASDLLIRGTYRQAYLPERNDVYTGFRTCAL